MCWSAEASLFLSTIGFTGAAFEFAKAHKKNLHGQTEYQADGFLSKYNLRGLTLFYFSLMELLQAVNYLHLNDVGPMNSLCSLLGFIHIAFQPVFTIWYIYSYLPLQRRRYWVKIGTPIAVLSALMFLCKLVLADGLPACFSMPCMYSTEMGRLFDQDFAVGCASNNFRSYVGDWHIAWQWVMNNCRFLAFGYFFTSFVLPVLSGSYRVMCYSVLVGPVLAFHLTTNLDEWAAIWCLLSIGFLTVAKIPFLSRLFTVRHQSWKSCFVSMGLLKSRWAWLLGGLRGS